MNYVVRVALIALISLLFDTPLTLAQTTGGSAPPPDEAASVHIGGTLFTDFTYTISPQQADAAGNEFHPSQFNVTRAYINVTGTLSRVIAFRLTPDIARDVTPGSLNGSLVFRVKYAYGQVNLDDWLKTGSWVRLGIQPAPWVEFEEGIYRYRFQGTVFAEREGFLTSSDAGVSFRAELPASFGDVHAGVYNGESFTRSEVNDQKAFEVRASVRPLASVGEPWRGLRVHVFENADSYAKSAARRRTDVSATFEHPRLRAGVEYLSTLDRPVPATDGVRAHGYSMWTTPVLHGGFEGLIRYDHLTPDETADATRTRTILGIAYWFPHRGVVTSALLVDYEGQTTNGPVSATPKQQRLAVHALVNF